MQGSSLPYKETTQTSSAALERSSARTTLIAKAGKRGQGLPGLRRWRKLIVAVPTIARLDPVQAEARPVSAEDSSYLPGMLARGDSLKIALRRKLSNDAGDLVLQ